MTDTKLKDPPPWARTRRWWLRALTEARAERDEAIKERDEAIEKLRQVKAQKLQAVKVLVGADDKEQQHS